MRLTKTLKRPGKDGNLIQRVGYSAAGIVTQAGIVSWDIYSDDHTYTLRFSNSDLTTLRAAVRALEEAAPCSR